MEEELSDEVEKSLEELAQGLANLAMGKARTDIQRQRMREGARSAFDRLALGMDHIMRFLSDPSQCDRTVFSEAMVTDLAQVAAIATAVIQHPKECCFLLAQETPLHEIFGFTEGTINGFYQAARSLYEQQHYQEAACAFSVLALFSPDSPIFWVGLGNSEYFCHNLEAALMAYAMGARADPKDPICHFFAAHCYEKLNHKDQAVNALELALLIMRESSEHEPLRQKVLAYKARLSQKQG